LIKSPEFIVWIQSQTTNYSGLSPTEASSTQHIITSQTAHINYETQMTKKIPALQNQLDEFGKIQSFLDARIAVLAFPAFVTTKSLPGTRAGTSSLLL